jgi:hypothetical protein
LREVHGDRLIDMAECDAACPVIENVIIDPAESPPHGGKIIERLLGGEGIVSASAGSGLTEANDRRAGCIALVRALNVGFEANEPIGTALPVVAELQTARDALGCDDRIVARPGNQGRRRAHNGRLRDAVVALSVA